MRGKVSKRIIRTKERRCVDWEDPVTCQRKRRIFDSKVAAQVLQDQVNKLDRPDRTAPAVLDPNVTVERFAAEFVWTQVATGAWTKPGTVATYREHLALRVCALDLGGRRLGEVRVRDLRREHAEALVTGMRRAGFAPATTRLSYMLFNRLLDRAVSRRLLAANPVDRDFFKSELRPLLKLEADSEPKAMTEPQAQQFLATAREHSRLFDLFTTGFLAGLRVGELTGLELDDDQVNVVGGHRVRQLHIVRTLLKDSTTHPVTGSPKSGKSRHVDVGAALGHMLDSLKTDRPKLALRAGWRPVPRWAFVTSSGRPVSHSALRQEFARVLTRAGLDGHGFTPHSMRHTFATTHIANGCNPKWLQQQLGHASITITYDVYGKWFKLADAKAADAVGDALLGNQLGNTGSR